MHIGQKVACINDSFPQWVHKEYTSLPIKDNIYTIRAIGMGVRPTHVGKNPDGTTVLVGEDEITILLEELVNPINPISKEEHGFISERFAPLQTDEEEVELEEELVALS